MPRRDMRYERKQFKSELSSYSNEDNTDLNKVPSFRSVPTGAVEAAGISASQHKASLGLWGNTLKLDFRPMLEV